MASGLIASIASIAGRNADFPLVSVVFLVLSLCAFAGAAVLGIPVALPRLYEEVDDADLGGWLERSSWEASGSLGLMRATQKRIDLPPSVSRPGSGEGKAPNLGVPGGDPRRALAARIRDHHLCVRD